MSSIRCLDVDITIVIIVYNIRCLVINPIWLFKSALISKIIHVYIETPLARVAVRLESGWLLLKEQGFRWSFYVWKGWQLCSRLLFLMF